MKFYLALLLSFWCCFLIAETYTFHTSGSYDVEANWDLYPGNILDNDDHIIIEENVYGIDLEVVSGTLTIGDNVNYMDIDYLDIGSGGTMEILTDDIVIEVYGSFYNSSDMILTAGFC